MKIAKERKVQKLQRKRMKTMKVRWDIRGVRKMRRRSKEVSRRRMRRTWLGGMKRIIATIVSHRETSGPHTQAVERFTTPFWWLQLGVGVGLRRTCL